MTATTTLDWDRIADAIRHPHRRTILLKLYEAGSNSPVFLGAASKSKRKLELRHNHLPRLESLEYVEWGDDTDTIRRGRRWPEIEPVLGMIQEDGLSDAAI